MPYRQVRKPPRERKQLPAGSAGDVGMNNSTSAVLSFGVDCAISRAAVSYDSGFDQQAIEHAVSKSVIAEAGFSYRFDGESATSKPSQDNNVNVQSIFLASKDPFTVEKVTIRNGPFKGRFALVLDPSPAKKNIFPFAKLPTEIRDMIYRILLVPEGYSGYYWSGVREYGSKSGHHYGSNAVDVTTNSVILALNKAIRQEAMMVFFRENVFRFDKCLHVEKFFNLYGPSSGFIRHIKVAHHKFDRSFVKFAKILVRASHLQSLELSIDSTDWRGLAYNMRPWFNEQGLWALSAEEDLREAVDRLVSIMDFGSSCEACGGQRKASRESCKQCDGTCECHHGIAENLEEFQTALEDMWRLEPSFPVYETASKKRARA
ncbi:hypothetical protein B9Z65_5187 [Elsinoe australis]|uniref:Uncharacterized protein n=1 Tax=Elsinoe australis TaxID=40998 RepID=A0A2P7ZDE1_9PEZI|nr:hypothetical protein B9Z65_5187 [Elsinoe australis]